MDHLECRNLQLVDHFKCRVTGLQQTFIEDYGLKKYAPIIMHLHHFSPQEDRPVYYSLSLPTTAIFSPRSTQATSNMADLRQLKDILERLVNEIALGNLGAEKTPFHELAKGINYSFYHTDTDIYNEIKLSDRIYEQDPHFASSYRDAKDLLFPEFSLFFRGCTVISKK